MRGVFDDREVQQAETRPDTELTLGSTTLLLIFFGLVLLCGLCFGLGYATGHRGTQETLTALPPGNSGRATSPADSGLPKPSADAQPGGAAPQPGAVADQQEPVDSTATDAGTQSSAAPAADGSSNGLPQVKPAFGSPPIPAQAGLPAASAVGPALGSAPLPEGSLMVQIAAVSRQEDANVLMSALRNRGYAVAAQREPLDGLIHVRIGPFKTRDEAEKWRIKLLNDGYNAVVQP
jgi:cell division septation protein DedD